jgi:hypothetical protein
LFSPGGAIMGIVLAKLIFAWSNYFAPFEMECGFEPTGSGSGTEMFGFRFHVYDFSE